MAFDQSMFNRVNVHKGKQGVPPDHAHEVKPEKKDESEDVEKTFIDKSLYERANPDGAYAMYEEELVTEINKALDDMDDDEYEALEEYVEKHLMGLHNQDKHDPNEKTASGAAATGAAVGGLASQASRTMGIDTAGDIGRSVGRSGARAGGLARLWGGTAQVAGAYPPVAAGNALQNFRAGNSNWLARSFGSADDLVGRVADASHSTGGRLAASGLDNAGAGSYIFANADAYGQQAAGAAQDLQRANVRGHAGRNALIGAGAGALANLIRQRRQANKEG